VTDAAALAGGAGGRRWRAALVRQNKGARHKTERSLKPPATTRFVFQAASIKGRDRQPPDGRR
jgi:hypothetical protein